ncbi:hypothetical protein ACFW2A_16210 [Streptomyces griseoluteus]|uniref:hypothetical protein n=1 Tax=Streptomyces griseoluteus TaxID=29306 RepID=UPI0036B24143
MIAHLQRANHTASLLTHLYGPGERGNHTNARLIARDGHGAPVEIDGVHQLFKAPIVLVWDHLNTHVSHAMRQLIAERAWLTVFLLPTKLR